MTKLTEQKHAPEAKALADAVLTAAGSGLRHYSTAKMREAILVAAQQGIDAGRADLLEALKEVERHHIEQNRVKGRDASRSKTLAIVRAAIGNATGKEAA
ncbi:hypothetical protein J8F10_09195 [Gemmata sp. G18]|uniref:Uncharacterized protein n=1 Tax=Gemmata palustris TaxID=2822762 RepID=A0ABS5BP06_9BACT|nr:hypothetical protein [Gemmata palustris]MBP3955456.1 hypothetical protein [Gemmata palustris]